MHMAHDRSTSGISYSELLAGLRSATPGPAWQSFLAAYSQTILSIARQYAYGADRLNDCYVYICEQLSDRGFRRLLAYEPEGAASFRGWLRVVIANLCIDWRRRSRGRPRPFRLVGRLSQLDQRVFDYRFQQRMNLQACLASLRVQFPGLTEPQLVSAIARVNSALSPRQHFLLSARNPTTLSLDDERHKAACEPRDRAPDPEQAATQHQESQRLAKALASLPHRQRLLIRLRYGQELSLKEVARLMRLGDPFRARREIQAALAALERLMMD